METGRRTVAPRSSVALRPAPAWELSRILIGIAVVGILVYAYVLRIAVGDVNPFDYFGYFTNQTSLIAASVLIGTGFLGVSGRRAPSWLTLLRGLVTAYLIVVGVIYNVLVPGTGSAPPWVSVVLHVVFPVVVVLDWLLVGDRPRLPWRLLWLLLPYPVMWLIVVLLRGVTDGWVPYGFLLPERGPLSLLLHIVVLLAAVLLAGVLVWSASRFRGVWSAGRRIDRT
ncbi:Pr6Pr family membrane protein [Microbacterium sp. STF-2]|uniref:Pr6Pr family membrane protein n=1 Tax=Microbacterium sp. STF-2 TaxID=3031132 RepID=UPI002AFEC7BC|nr:Pr6Pr family membrane protein [Microbacterium sp. STF-2]MEA1263748.1 Pr6Pr family membrane protein [Microbacterium sp. STF-2]